jgi:nitroimidazol reductase NimA-like FMN-containing flavoprotein (pyridoxamine 5'-phosphate oxidase superfamily)
MISKLSEEESLSLLRDKRVARLGCVVGNEPYVVPLNYVFDDRSVLGHSLPGRKLTAMRENPRVCVQVDDIKDFCSWKSVIAYGGYEEITDPVERERTLNRLLSSFPNLTPVESLSVEDATATAPVVFRIRVDSITGISEGWG